MDSIISSGKNVLSNIKCLLRKNWKYFAFYSFGSCVSLAFCFNYAYKLSGYENPKQFLFAIYLKYQCKQYNKPTSTWRLSQYIPIRPSSELCVLDKFFYNFIRANGDPIKRQNYINKPIRDKVIQLKQLTCSKSTYDINPTLLPFGSNQQLINKYIKEIKINGFRSLKINYPGTELTKQNNNIILGFHGASNVGGAPEHFRSYLVLLSKFTNSTCYSVEYGLAPEYIMPVQVDHVINAYKYILNEYKTNGINKIFLSGHSAGGNIILLALQKLSNKKDIRYPDGGIILSANVDRTFSGESFVTNDNRDAAIDKDMFMAFEELAVGNIDMNGKRKNKNEWIDMKHSDLSPLYGNVNGLCDLYVYVGANEGLLSQNQQFVEKCKKANIDVEYEYNQWLPHNGPLMCDSVVEARDCVVRIAEWIKQRL